MDVIEIGEVVFGALFILLALIGSIQIFGGMFYTKKVRAVVSDKSSRRYVRIDGQTYSGRNEMNLAERRDRRRHRQSGDRRKRRYREHSVDHISFAYEEGGEIRKTDPKSTICPVSKSFVDSSLEYNIKVSRSKPWKARLGLFEILRAELNSSAGIVTKLFSCIFITGSALLMLAADVGLAAFGALLISLGLK